MRHRNSPVTPARYSTGRAEGTDRVNNFLNRHDRLRAFRWKNNALELLDQRRLPHSVDWVRCQTAMEVAAAIRALVVRGAPAIGIAAAYGTVLASRSDHFEEDVSLLRAARPTAVNLMWAMDRMVAVADRTPERLLIEARAIEQEDLVANQRMSKSGAERLDSGCGVLTHCNTGSLATAGLGTALGVIRCGYAAGKIQRVFAGETRPWLQGSRLTAWELSADGIPVQLLADAAAPYLMCSGQVQWVIVGADRVAANGDVANKIGTYALALAARHHGLHTMVVAASSTIDMRTPDGNSIPIELRDPEELLTYAGQAVAPAGVSAWNPVFDITPAELVDVLVTEKGRVEHPNRARMHDLFGA